jgi:hypothetical protein
VVQLNRLDWRQYLKRPNPAAAALMARVKIAPAERVKVKAEILRLLLTLRLRPEKAQLILGFVETYLELTAGEELKLRRETAKFPQEDQEKIMKMLLPGERHGRFEGRKEGRQEGRRAEAADLLARLARKRFADFAPKDEATIRQLSLVRLENLSEALLDFSSIGDLRHWLAEHGKHHENAAARKC